MTEVFWLEQTAVDMPEGRDWLSAAEFARAQGLLFARRRADWLLGRWTAKRAVAAYWKLPTACRVLASIEIHAASSGAPQVFRFGQAAAVAISLSHRAGRAACAVAPDGTALGCDLELIEPRSDAFVADYFTAEEQILVARTAPAHQPLVANLLWSAKESALKARGVGLRADTRCVRVRSVERFWDASDAWCPFEVDYDPQIMRGWWQSTGAFLRTLVAVPSPRMPETLFAESAEEPLLSVAAQ